MKLSFKKIIILLIGVIGLFYYFLGSNFDSLIGNGSSDFVDLTLKMESELGLKEVLISKNSEGALEMRSKKPDNVSKEDLAMGTAYLFGYLEDNIDTEKVRVIYTVDYLDNIIFETSLSDISDWKNLKIDNNEFAKKIVLSLPVTK